MPKTVYDRLRVLDILDAMQRYANAKMPVPIDWVMELKDLLPYERT